MTQSVDHVALLPAYLAAGTAVLVLLADLLVARRGAVARRSAALGALATAVGAVWSALRATTAPTFCVAGRLLVRGRPAAPPLIAAVFALLTLGVLGALRRATAASPPGEYCFLLACSMTGGVVLGRRRRPDHADRGAGDADPAAVRAGRPAPARLASGRGAR